MANPVVIPGIDTRVACANKPPARAHRVHHASPRQRESPILAVQSITQFCDAEVQWGLMLKDEATSEF